MQAERRHLVRFVFPRLREELPRRRYLSVAGSIQIGAHRYFSTSKTAAGITP